MRKIKKSKRSTLKRKLDKIWSEKVRSLGHCEKCGAITNLNAAHIVSRRFTHVRHDLRNGLCLCVKCHMWGHDKPTEFSRWVEELRGKKVIEELEQLALLNTKPDYEAVINFLDSIERDLKQNTSNRQDPKEKEEVGG